MDRTVASSSYDARNLACRPLTHSCRLHVCHKNYRARTISSNVYQATNNEWMIWGWLSCVVEIAQHAGTPGSPRVAVPRGYGSQRLRSELQGLEAFRADQSQTWSFYHRTLIHPYRLLNCPSLSSSCMRNAILSAWLLWRAFASAADIETQ